MELLCEEEKRPFIKSRTKRMSNHILMCLIGFLNDCHLIKMDGSISLDTYLCVCVCVFS